MAVKKSTQAEVRAKDVEKGIRLAWSSLETHLGYTHSRSGLIRNETHNFHKKCVREYVEIISILTRLY